MEDRHSQKITLKTLQLFEEKSLTEEDFPEIEKKMRKIIQEGHAFEREELQKEDALHRLDAMGEPYKREYAEELFENGSTFSLREAQICVNAVKKKCLLQGKNKLDKMRLKKPEPLYQLNEDYNEEQDRIWEKRRKKIMGRLVRESRLETREARRKLKKRKMPENIFTPQKRLRTNKSRSTRWIK